MSISRLLPELILAPGSSESRTVQLVSLLFVWIYDYLTKSSSPNMAVSEKPKLGLLSLPPELLLQIASYHLDDFLFWQSNQCRNPSKYSAKHQLKSWPYLALSKTHPYPYSLLITQRLNKQSKDKRINFDLCGLFD